MPTIVHDSDRAVLKKWEEKPPRRAADWPLPGSEEDFAATPGRRRSARELAPVPNEMGLVGVAGDRCHITPRERLLRNRQFVRVLEAQDSGEGLRRQAHLTAKPLGEVPAAPAEFLGDRTNLDATPRGDEAAPRLGYLGAHPVHTVAAGGTADSSEEQFVQRGEPRRPCCRRSEPVDQLDGKRSEKLVEWDQSVGELGGGHAVDGPGSERCQRQLNTSLASVVVNRDGPAPQAAGHAAESGDR